MQFYILIVLTTVFVTGYARKHRLVLENDDRQDISLTTFGLVRGGFIYVNVTDFKANFTDTKNANNPLAADNFGFTLDKAKNAGLTKFVTSNSNGGPCALDKKAVSRQADVSVVLFNFDFENRRIRVERQEGDLYSLWIMHLKSVSTVADLVKVRSNRRPTKPLPGATTTTTTAPEKDDNAEHKVNDPAQSNLVKTQPNREVRKKRADPSLPTTATNLTTTTTTTAPKPITTATAASKTNALESGKGDSKVPPIDKDQNLPPVVAVTEEVILPADRNISDILTVTFNETAGSYSFYFAIAVLNGEEEGLYNLIFHNCQPNKQKRPANLSVYLEERNGDNYLSAGDQPLPTVFFVFAVVYFAIAMLWLYVLCTSSTGVFKIHYLMFVVVLVKSLSLIFHGLNYHFIAKEGYQEEAFAILWYITYLVRGILLFVTILLIGVGWAFIKHVLSDREKKIFVVVIPLQILSNISQIIIEETEEGESQYLTWRDILILVDLVCCGAILFPVVWSIRHLQDSSQTDGKAAISLAKLKIFRHFYILIVCYIYSTRIVVYLLEITLPFQLSWLQDSFFEVATLAFFILTGYKFRPASNNPYLQLPTDSDDEDDVDEIVTRSGLLETVNKVNVRTSEETSFMIPETTSRPNKREASLEYD